MLRRWEKGPLQWAHCVWLQQSNNAELRQPQNLGDSVLSTMRASHCEGTASSCVAVTSICALGSTKQLLVQGFDSGRLAQKTEGCKAYSFDARVTFVVLAADFGSALGSTWPPWPVRVYHARCCCRHCVPVPADQVTLQSHTIGMCDSLTGQGLLF